MCWLTFGSELFIGLMFTEKCLNIIPCDAFSIKCNSKLNIISVIFLAFKLNKAKQNSA